MDMTFTVFLVLHIIGGSLGLITGTINLVRKKGDKKHKLVGKVFAWAMLTAGFSSLVLSIMHPNYFLFMIGVFTIYLVGTGYRYVYIKTMGGARGPSLVDWAITVVMLLAGLLFIGLGTRDMLAQNSFGIVFIVFGALGLRFVQTDFKNYRGLSKETNYWLLAHLQRMTGGYIAAVTAFLVVNAKYSPVVLPSFVYWLLPTIVLTPLIIRWSRNNKAKVSVQPVTQGSK